MRYYLKTQRGEPATELDGETAQKLLKRGRHEGRRLVEVFVLQPDGSIDRYQERARRKLGSNAIVSRTWLAETYQPGQDDAWANDRYIHGPAEAIQEADPAPDGAILVLLGAENDDEANVAQLEEQKARS